ncbi:serine/threonine protein kinase [Planctomycetota bacterium]
MSNPYSRLLAKLAVEAGLITSDQLQECLAIEKKYVKAGKKPMPIDDMLSKKGYLSPEDHERLLAFDLSKGKKSFGECAVENRFCSSEQVEKMLEVQKKLRQQGQKEPIDRLLVKHGFLKEHQVEVIQKRREDQATEYFGKTGLVPERPFENPGKLLIGETVGRYTIEAEFPPDSLGWAYLAEKKDDMRKVVARVASRPEVLEGKLFKQIKASFEKLQDTKSKFLRRPFSLELLQDKSVLVTNEYVEGITLFQYVQTRGKIKWYRAIQLILMAIEALKDAQEQGIWHGDLRPDNLFLTTKREVLVENCGILSQMKIDPWQILNRPEEHAIFIAPERTLAGAEPDFRADIFGLGATLYFLISGKVMFTGQMPMEIMYKLSTQKMTSLQGFSKKVPAAVDDVIRKMMHPEPAERFQDYGTLVKELESVVSEPDVEENESDDDVLLEIEGDSPPQPGIKTPWLPPAMAAKIGRAKKSEPKQDKTMLAIIITVSAVGIICALLFGYYSSSPKNGANGRGEPGNHADGDQFQFDEPDGSYMQKYMYYKRIADSDPDFRRQAEAGKRQQAVMDQMNRKAQAQWREITRRAGRKLDNNEFQAAQDIVDGFDLDMFFTRDWRRSVGKQTDLIKDLAEKAATKLRSEVEALVKTGEFDAANKLLNPYLKSSHPQIFDLMAELRQLIQEERNRSGRESTFQAEQKRIADSQAHLDGTIEKHVLPYIKVFNFDKARAEFRKLKKNTDNRLVEIHVTKIGEYVDEVNRYKKMYSSICSKAKKVCKENVIILDIAGESCQLTGIQKKAVFFAKNIASGKRVKMDMAKASRSKNYEIIRKIAVANGDPKLMGELLAYFVHIKEPINGLILLHSGQRFAEFDEKQGKQLDALAMDWVRDLSKSVGDEHSFYRKILAHKSGEDFREFLPSIVFGEYRNLLSEFMVTSFNADTYGTNHSGFDFSQQKQLRKITFEKGQGTLVKGQLSLQKRVTMAWPEQNNITACKFLFQFSSPKGSLSIDFGQINFECKVDPDKDSTFRVKGKGKFITPRPPLFKPEKWHLLAVIYTSTAYSVVLDGIVLGNISDGDADPKALRISFVGDGELRIDDFYIWQNK